MPPPDVLKQRLSGPRWPRHNLRLRNWRKSETERITTDVESEPAANTVLLHRGKVSAVLNQWGSFGKDCFQLPTTGGVVSATCYGFFFSPKTCDLTKSHRNIFLIFKVNSLLQRSIFKKKCVWKYSLLLWVSASNNNNNRKTALGSAASVYTAQRCNKYVMWVMARHA